MNFSPKPLKPDTTKPSVNDIQGCNPTPEPYSNLACGYKFSGFLQVRAAAIVSAGGGCGEPLVSFCQLYTELPKKTTPVKISSVE